MNNNFTKYILIFISVFALLFASCKDSLGISFETEDVSDGMGYVSINIGGNSRTAYPVIENSDYENWYWTIKGLHVTDGSGTYLSEDWKVLREFDPVNNIASSVAIANRIGVKSGDWKFSLTAERIIQNNNESVTVATYSGESVEYRVENGDPVVNVAITLTLTQLDTRAYGVLDWGNMNLTVSYASTKVSEIWAGLFQVPSFTEDESLTPVTLSGSGTGIYSTVYTSLVPVTPEDGAATDKYAVKKLTGKVYSLTEVPAGNYVASFWFFDKDGNALNAYGYEEYVHIVSGGEASRSESTVNVASLDDVYSITYYPAPSTGAAGSFTRHSDTITLPDASSLDTSALLFCGWYESSDYSGTPVLEIPHGTRGNKKFYGKYVNAKEAYSLPEFRLTYASGRLEVGNTVTVSFENSNIPSCTYQWYDGETAISGKTENTYKLLSSDVGKTLGAKVQKKYLVSDYSGTADHVLYHIVSDATENESSTVALVSPVAKGTIAFSGVTLQYGGKVIVGEKPSKSSLIISGKLTDDFGNTISSSALDCDFEDYSALTSSKELEVTVGIEGYTVTGTTSPSVYITVQHAKPTEASLRSVNDALGEGEANLGDGNVAFNLATVAMGLQYSTDGGSSWTNVTSAQFTKPSSLLVRKMASGTSGAEGYIMASESVTVPVTTANVGTVETEAGTAGGGSDTPVVVEENICLLSGPEINSIFIEKFKTVTKFEYTTESAPSTATTISVTSGYANQDTFGHSIPERDVSTIEVLVWKSSLTLYITASGYTGEIPLPADCSEMFKGMTRLTSIDLSHFTMVSGSDDIEYNLSEMFSGCSKLKTINFGSYLHSDCITDMSSMFYGTSALTEIDLSNFDTSSVTDMSYMFAGSGVSELDLSTFNTSSVETMTSMFEEASVESIEFGTTFNTSSVTDMSFMFASTYLSELDLSAFDTSSVATMESMFDNMFELTELDLSGYFEIASGCNADNMFSYCENLSKIYVDDGDDWSATIASGTGDTMFEGCVKLVGGNGTLYQVSEIGAEYARADKPGTNGYFTAVE